METQNGTSSYVPRQKVDRSEEQLSLTRVVLLISIHLAAGAALFHYSLAALCAFGVTYYLTGCLGLTVGYHRLLTHRSFETPKWVRNILALLGTLTLQGSPSLWVATHRAHHGQTDQLGDPHSSRRGFLWSHFLWMCYANPNGFRYSRHREKVADVANTAFIQFLDQNYLFVNAAAFLLVLAVFRRWDIALWAFPLRIVVFWHATWLVNSYAHAAPLKAKAGAPSAEGSARNSLWLSLLMFGEGWHANHHRTPGSASFQTSSWHIDLGFYSILVMRALGLASFKPRQELAFSS